MWDSEIVRLFILHFVSDNMHLKFTAKNIVSSLVEEQEKAIQRHGTVHGTNWLKTIHKWVIPAID
jgi:hypothetical protein